jgi:hypothetical protein
MRCIRAVSNLIAAFIYLCPIATLPSACGPETAFEFHVLNVPAGSCGRDAQEMAAHLYGDREFVMKIVCQRSSSDEDE